MAARSDDDLVEQMQLLLQQFGGSFPYDDCRKILGDIAQASSRQGKRCQDFIPDLDSYFYAVDTYAGGVRQVLAGPSAEIARAQSLLKNSFFQAHPKYRSLEWMVNQINTPELSQKIALSNQLRHILLELIARQLLNQQQICAERQVHFLSVAS